jgi:outer membrane protein
MKRLLTGLTFLILSQNAWAGEPLDLGSAVQLALQHAPEMSAAEAARDASHEQESQARAGLMPVLKATGKLNSIRQRNTYTRPNGFLVPRVNYQQRDAGISLVQPIFHYDRWAGLEQGTLASESGDIRLDLQRQQLLLEVASAYTALLSAREELAATNAQVEAVGKLHAQAQAAFKVGTATINDALEAQSRLDLAKAARIKAASSVAQQKARLSSLVGSAVDHLRGFSGSFQLVPLQPATIDAWEHLAEQHSLAVQLADKQHMISDAEIRRSAGMAMPSLDLVAGIDRLQSTDSQFGTGTTTNQTRIGLELEIPLYAGGATWSKLRQARSDEVNSAYLLLDAKRKARLDAHAAFLAVESASARILALEQALTSAEKARQAARVGYEVGLRTIVELLDAEERLYSARSDLASARSDYLMARLQLYAAAGRLDMPQIDQANTLLTADTSTNNSLSSH